MSPLHPPLMNLDNWRGNVDAMYTPCFASPDEGS